MLLVTISENTLIVVMMMTIYVMLEVKRTALDSESLLQLTKVTTALPKCSRGSAALDAAPSLFLPPCASLLLFI